MSARIAPEPVSTAMTTVADYRSRAFVAEPPASPAASGSATDAGTQRSATGARSNDALPPLPAPPDPPGTMFAAAVMAGALSPKPETPQEIFLRIGRDWSPPDSDLHLADRLV
jgi:hypothetical protein